MKYLLDTHTFIWTALKTKNLGTNCVKILYSKNYDVYLSTVSFWELSIKISLNKFLFQNYKVNDFPQIARNMGFSIIDLQEHESITFHELPPKDNHKDPFDRMIIWQAITKNMTLISKDDKFEQYKKDGLKLIW